MKITQWFRKSVNLGAKVGEKTLGKALSLILFIPRCMLVCGSILIWSCCCLCGKKEFRPTRMFSDMIGEANNKISLWISRVVGGAIGGMMGMLTCPVAYCVKEQHDKEPLYQRIQVKGRIPGCYNDSTKRVTALYGDKKRPCYGRLEKPATIHHLVQPPSMPVILEEPDEVVASLIPRP